MNHRRRGYAPPIPIAMIHTALGEKEEALRWLDEGYRARDGNMVLLKVLPAYGIRSAPTRASRICCGA